MLPYATNEIVGYTDVQPTGETCEDVKGMAAGWHEPDSNPDGSTQANRATYPNFKARALDPSGHAAKRRAPSG